MMRKAVAALVIVGILSGAAVAARPEDAVLPEFLAGTLAAYAGGIIGAYTLSAAFAAGAQGWGALAAAILGAVLGYTGGTILGSSLGVIGAGALLGVEGNVGLCFLGAAGGTGVMVGIGLAFEFPETVFLLAPPVAAAGATAGFNVGARSRR